MLAWQVKKRGAARLHWDVSYKVEKHVAQHHGKPLYKGLLTATNEVGEVRFLPCLSTACTPSLSLRPCMCQGSSTWPNPNPNSSPNPNPNPNPSLNPSLNT